MKYKYIIFISGILWVLSTTINIIVSILALFLAGLFSYSCASIKEIEDKK